MPGISLLNSNVFSASVEPRRVIGSWIMGFFFLLLLWAVDQWIADRFNRSKRATTPESPAKTSPALRFTIQTLVNLILIIAFIHVVDPLTTSI